MRMTREEAQLAMAINAESLWGLDEALLDDPSEGRERLIQLAAVAIAAIERDIRVERTWRAEG